MPYKESMHQVAKPDCVLIIGLCSHGLALARDLRRASVEVFAVKSNQALPGVATRCAQVFSVPSINDVTLIDSLLDLAGRIASGRTVVLLPTNDHQVRVLCVHNERLVGHYTLSWAHCAKDIGRRLLKSQNATRCTALGIHYPRSWVFDTQSEVRAFDTS